MHKLMGLLMTGSGDGRVIQAARQIGEAIEHELHSELVFTSKNWCFWLLEI
uniref:Uncharacterized protein n=1 Tax=Arundo donax TaxID=35708 RepID=A0A0A9A3L6_ARUDO